MRCTFFLVALALSACNALPQDPEGTLDHIEDSRRLRVGLVAGTAGSEKAAALVADLAHRAGAKPTRFTGPADPLLAALDRGDLDLVIGPFAKDSLLSAEYAFGPPLAVTGDKNAPIELKAAMRNGENRWIMRVEQASRAVAPEIRER